jgi:regulator of protease activity HflC (stomatin/prohibitin superfamily)
MKAYVLSLDEGPPPKAVREKWRRFVENWLPTVVIFLMVAALVIIVILPRVVVTVPSGQIGVLWKRFEGGTVLDPREIRDEGLHLILPWDKLFIYDLRVQSLSETYGAISSDGVNMTVTINTRYRLQRDSVPALHQVVGPDYTKVLGPQIASEMREVISHYTAEQVYSSARQEIQDKIRQAALDKLGHKMIEREADERSYNVAMRDTIVLYDTLLYGIELPATVVSAINRKAEQYYVSEEYKFRIEREKKESERKRIEAEGIRDFQQIVSKGISDSYLRWRGIEATLQLAQSNNAKIVIIGNSKDGLPIILNPEAAPAAARTAEGATGEETPASGSATPVETLRPSNLSTPAEKPNPDQSTSAAPAAAQKPSPVGGALSVRSILPLTVLDLASYYFGLLRSSESGSEEAKPSASTTTRQTH